MDDVLDVIIVGAGVAGLSSAYTIKKGKPDAKILILEANDRLGGRLCRTTLKGPSEESDYFDLGGHWVSRTQPHAMQMVNELDLETEWQDYRGATVSTFGNKRWKHHARTDLGGASFASAIDLKFALDKINKFLELLPAYDFRECQYAKAWDAATLETFKQNTMMTKEGKLLFDAITGVTGALPTQTSLLYFLHYCQVSGGLEQLTDSTKPGNAQEMKVKGGTYQLITHLAEKVGNDNIFLNTVASSVHQNNEHVTVTTSDKKTFYAKLVILSIPVHCKAKLEYNPPLPRDQAAFLERMPMSQATKFFATYKTRFWKEKGLSGDSGHIRLEEDEEWWVSVTMDASTDKVPALVGFLFNDFGSKFRTFTAEEQKSYVIKALVRFFGEDASEVIDFVIKDWSEEPYVGGCPVGVTAPGTYTLFDEENLRRPFGKIHWAGTETATLWRGYIDGAIQSGMRSAYEVLTLLKDGFIVPTLYSVNDIRWREAPKEGFLSSFRRKQT